VDSVALAATIGGSVVGLAGVGATAWGSWLQRGSAKELAASQHEHERELARGARLFDRRQPVYEEMLRLLYPWAERVEATDKIITFADEPDPPDLPSREAWREMQIRFATIGSRAVADSFLAFGDVLRDFWAHVGRMRNIREHGGGDLAEAATATEEARREVVAALRKTERLVSEELAAL
jgi:hypothetical protein